MAKTVLYIEVSLFQSVLIEGFHCVHKEDLALLICGPKEFFIIHHKFLKLCAVVLVVIALCSHLKKLGMLQPLLLSLRVQVSTRKRYLQHKIPQITVSKHTILQINKQRIDKANTVSL